MWWLRSFNFSYYLIHSRNSTLKEICKEISFKRNICKEWLLICWAISKLEPVLQMSWLLSHPQLAIGIWLALSDNCYMVQKQEVRHSQEKMCIKYFGFLLYFTIFLIKICLYYEIYNNFIHLLSVNLYSRTTIDINLCSKFYNVN